MPEPPLGESADELIITARTRGGEITIELEGDLRGPACQALADQFDRCFEIPADAVTLNLRAVHAVDAAGVRTVLLAHLRLADRGTALIIVPGPPAVQAMFDRIDGPFRYCELDA